MATEQSEARGSCTVVDAGVRDAPISVVAALLQAVLDKGASFRFRAVGVSMTPFIQDGDVITIAPVRRHIGLGQVVAYLRAPCQRRHVLANGAQPEYDATSFTKVVVTR